MASFEFLGYRVRRQDLLKRIDSGKDILLATILSSEGRIPSGPAALSFTRSMISSSTWENDTGENSQKEVLLSGPEGSTFV